MAVISAFSKCLVPPVQDEVTPPPETANKNWNPGNWIEFTSDGEWDTPTNLSVNSRGVVQRLRADTAGNWKGAMERYTWPQLETTQGNYTNAFNKIENRLAQIANLDGRKLMIFIGLKTFGAGSSSIPAYMRTGAYSDGTSYQGSLASGEFSYASGNGGDGGRIPSLHVAAVRARFDAMMAAFAARFNGNPHLEAIVFSEAALAPPIGAPGGNTASSWINLVNGGKGWLDGMRDSFITMRPLLSNIQICQWVNSPRTKMNDWVPQIQAAGIGVGMTDLCSEDLGFNYRNDLPGAQNIDIGNIMHCQNSNGQAIVIGHCSDPATNGTISARNQVSNAPNINLGHTRSYPTYPGIGQSRQALRDFAVNTVGVTHLVWIHRTYAHPQTGTRDPLSPASANAYTIYGNYGGQSINKITDEWISNPASNITTVTARPVGWT